MATTPEVRKGITEEQQQELDDVFTRARKALAIIETYDQARVDRLCQAVAWAVANKRTFTKIDTSRGGAADALKSSEKAVSEANRVATADIVVNFRFYLGGAALSASNDRHLANAAVRGKINEACRRAGLVPPIICTPEELMEPST